MIRHADVEMDRQKDRQKDCVNKTKQAQAKIKSTIEDQTN